MSAHAPLPTLAQATPPAAAPRPAEAPAVALPPAASRAGNRSNRRWLWAICGGLVLALAGVAYVQSLQFKLLNSKVQYAGDNIVWSFFQLEAESLRLRDLLQDAIRYPEHADHEALQERYDIFVSRIELVAPERTAPWLPATAQQAETVTHIQHFVAQADHLLGPGARGGPLSRAELMALATQLDALREPIHALSQKSSHQMAEQIGSRNEAVRQQNRISIGLSVFQAALTLLFAAVVLRQFRLLRLRQNQLERFTDKLHDARLAAEAASSAKSEFLANMSHEIRTPFQGLLGMLDLLRDSTLSLEQRDQLQTATSSAQHLLTVLNDILDLSKLESGNLSISPVVTDLDRLLSDFETLMREPAQAKGLQFQVQRSPQLPRWVQTDPMRLRQILFNLTSNAIKFSERGTVSIQVLADRSIKLHPRLQISVVDSGIGMDEHTLARLFQRFSQGDESTARRFGGSGLGLEISRRLARLMEGDITVESSLAVGSTFVLTLPLRAVEAPATQRAGPAVGAAGRRVLRVLVSEDHPVNRKYLGVLLAGLGHHATFCENGEEAFHAVRDGELFDVVLMDVHTPVMDGLAATRAIRALPGPRGATPVIALTADAFDDARQRAIAAGMTDFLTKPVTLPELAGMLDSHFPALGSEAGSGSGSEAEAEPASAPQHDAAATAATAATSVTAAEPVWVDDAFLAEIYLAVPRPAFAALIQRFMADDSGTIASLQHALDGGSSHAEVQEAAHKFRGAALNLGLRGLAELLQGIEATPPQDATPAAQQAWSAQLSAALQHTLHALQHGGHLPAP